MRLDRLRVRRRPGIVEPFTLDGLAPTLTVILGPNASGKTSICRTVRSLLWPSGTGAAERQLDADAVFESADGARRLVERTPAGTLWRRDGDPADPPSLPPPHLAHCYTITIEELLEQGESDAELARLIAVQMAGGFDLERAVAAFHTKQSHGRAERNAHVEARQRLRKIRTDQGRLFSEEIALDGLRRELDTAERAGERRRTLELAVELATARAHAAECAVLLRDFPPGLAGLLGDERRRLDELRDDETSSRREIETVDAELGALADELAATAAVAALDAEALESIPERVDRLREARRDRSDAARAHDVARAELDAALVPLGVQAAAFDPSRIDRASLAEVESHLAGARAAAHRLTELDAQLAALGEGPIGPPEQALRDAAAALRAQLTAARRDPVLRGLVVSALVVALGAALAVAWRIHPLGWLAVTVLLAIAAGLAIRERLRGDATARSAYERTGLDGPTSWARSDVERRLEEVEGALQEARRRAAAMADRDRLTTRREQAIAALDEFDARRSAIAGRLGLGSATLGELAFDVLAGRLEKALAAATALAGADARLQSAAEACDAVLRGVADIVESAGRARPIDADAAEVGARVVLDLHRRRRAAEDDERRARVRRDSCQELLARTTARIAALLDAADVPAGDERELDRRLELLADHRSAATADRDARRDVARLADRLADEPELLELDQTPARRLLDEATGAAEAAGDLRDRIAAIEASVRAAGDGHDLADALRASDAAEDAVKARRDEALDQAAARFLLGEARREHEHSGRPAVLEAAQEIFDRFTAHRYRLRAESMDGAGTFVAHDLELDRALAPHELSTGTRAQLLLAVRLAFVRTIERGEALPLFVDEALANADEDRFARAIEALIDLAIDGRQVFYLTSRRTDAARALAAARARSVEPAVIDLAALRGRAAAASLSHAIIVEAPPVPSAAGHDADGYARTIGAGPVDLWRPGATHLVHLLPDRLDLVETMLRAGLPRLDPARRAIDGGGAAGLDDAARRCVEARLAAAAATLAALRIGVGRPLDRDALVESGAVTGTFLDRVSELAASLGGDAEALLEALAAREDERAKGFRQQALDGLEAHLRSTDHLDERPRLDEGSVAAHVHAALGDSTRCDLDGIRLVVRTLCRAVGRAGPSDPPLVEVRPRSQEPSSSAPPR